MSFKKIDKEFCITDNSVNCYGYRLLTEGFLLNKFNPSIGYFMHDRDKGVAVRWSDFRIDGDKVYAKPIVNTVAFPDLANQIENGFYQAASVGHIIALEWTDDASMKLEGQTGITVTKWFCRECSIVDIPGNYSAFSELYDSDNNSLKNLISKNPQSLSSSVEDVPEKYKKSFVELFEDGVLDYVRNTYPKYYEKIVDDYKSSIINKESKSENTVIPTQKKENTYSKSLQANHENSIPEKYKGMTYRELWLSGDLETLRRTHPRYVKELQEADKIHSEKEKNRGTAKKSEAKEGETIINTSDLSIPEQYRGKTRKELYLNGGLAYLKAHHPNVYNDLISR